MQAKPVLCPSLFLYASCTNWEIFMLKGKPNTPTVTERICCHHCGEPFLWTHPKGGKRRKYCGGACRESARRHREDWPAVRRALGALATAAAVLPEFAADFVFASDFLRDHRPRRIQRR